jgi:hypothetical protein
MSQPLRDQDDDVDSQRDDGRREQEDRARRERARQEQEDRERGRGRERAREAGDEDKEGGRSDDLKSAVYPSPGHGEIRFRGRRLKDLVLSERGRKMF